MAQKRLEEMTLRGRYFPKKDFKLIKEIVSDFPNLSRTELAKTICENLSWYQSNGKPKYDACRKVLEKLESWGKLTLPAAVIRRKAGSRQIKQTAKSNPGNLIKGQIDEYGSIIIDPVFNREEMELWKEYIERYHYLGFKTTFGCQQRYFIKFSSGKLLGCLLFSASAWSVQCRDKWIGWRKEERIQFLHLIIGNSRFLIFPWVKIKNLASKALSSAIKRIPADWEKRYKYRPVLIESFVDQGRFAGTCYRASNWKYLGVTKGRGRMDRNSKYLSSLKEVFVYPLSPSFRGKLKGGIK